MQVPERLALIGGSILLSSTLVFTLKSQASSILPKIEHPISSIYGHIGDTQKSVDFDGNFKDAQKNGETTGTWGTSKYYIDKDNNLHVGKGNLQGSLISVIGDTTMNSLKGINIDQPVQAPQDSSYLFAGLNGPYGDGNHSINNIDGLSNVDTSNATNMALMFGKLRALSSVDLSNWNTSNVTNMNGMFNDDQSLTSADLSNWNTSRVTDMSMMFNSGVLQRLNINTFDTTHANTDSFLGGNWMPSGSNNNILSEITLGSNTKLSSESRLPSNNWNNGNQTINTDTINDGNSHPGTWTKQYDQATNISPITKTDNWNGGGWIYSWTFHAEKGKTYYLSADYHHVTANVGELYSVQANGGDGNASIWNGGHNAIPTGLSGTSVAKWTANQTGDVSFGFGANNTDKITNINITQSNSYIPYDRTTQNHNDQ